MRSACPRDEVRDDALSDEALRNRLLELAGSVRLTGSGDLAAGLVHELNQPLCAILNYAEACLTLIAGSDAERGALAVALSQIRDQAQRAGTVMRRLRDVIGRRPTGRTLCDLNALIADSIELMHAAIDRHGGRVEFVADAAVPRVSVDSVALQQLIATLIRGSVEAVGELAVGDRSVRIQTRAVEGEAEVTVSDARIGVSDGLCAEMFDPLFTNGTHSGLGLALGRAMVESLGGRMWANASPDGGLSISFSLPAAKEE